MSIPRVAPRLERELDGVDVILRGIVEVAVESSAFLLLVFWLSDASSIRGWRYVSMGGIVSAMRADFGEVSWASWSKCRSNDTWMKLPPCSGDTFSSWASMSKSSSATS